VAISPQSGHVNKPRNTDRLWVHQYGIHGAGVVQFEDRLKRLQNTGTTPDKRIAQVDRLKTENAKLRDRLTQAEQAIAELGDFRGQVLARLAAQHGEIFRLRAIADTSSRVARLPARRHRLARGLLTCLDTMNTGAERS
jgi:chromosome segregation ATPase